MNLKWPELQPALATSSSISLADVLLDFQGPQVAIWTVDDAEFIGVAADDEGEVVRWISAPVSRHELRAVKVGSVTVRDLLSQPSVLIFDQDGDGEVRRYAEIDLQDVPELAFPQPGVPLPDELTAWFRQNLGPVSPTGSVVTLDGSAD